MLSMAIMERLLQPFVDRMLERLHRLGSTRSLTFAEPTCIACILRRNVCHRGLIFHFIGGLRIPGSMTHLHGPSAVKGGHRYVPFSVIYVRHGPGSYSLGRGSVSS